MYSQGYIIDVQICVVVLYLVYITLLHRHVSYTIERSYMILMLPVALVIPLINLPLLPTMGIVTTLENVSEAEVSGIFKVRNPILDYGFVYFIGLGIMLLWWFVGLIKLFLLFRHSTVERIGRYKVVFIEQESYAYTILNYIFINEKFRDKPMLSELIAHESEHVKLGHTYDLIYINIMRMLFWFNPIVWHIQYLLRQIHEYQVDRSVIEKGYSLKNYVNLLIMSEAGISPEFTTPFGYSFTKKRITMLLKKNQTNNRGRLFVTIPVLVSLLFAFSVTSKASVELPVEGVQLDTVSKQLKVSTKLTEKNGGTELVNPLYVVNGVESSKSKVEKMDMNNVKTVTILKDESAKKIYGEAGKNGVVVIETDDVKVVEKEGATKITSVDLTRKGQLFIINGLEAKYEDYTKLSMDVIKKVTVLESVPGEKIYGRRGANGVVIIETTKSDNSGEVIVEGIYVPKTTGK